MQWNY